MTPLVTTDRLDHVHLNVTDRPASIAWYGRVLGLNVLGDANPDPSHPVFLAPASVSRLCLSLFVGELAVGPNRNIAFHSTAKDFAAFARHLPNADILDHKGQPLHANSYHDYGMALNFDFADPDGNHIELVTYECDAARAALSGLA